MQLGPLFLLDSVQYFPRVYIRPGRYFYHHRLSALQKGRPFSIAALEDDRTVTRAFLREHGYYYLKSEHIGYEADTLITPQRVNLRTVLSATTPPEALRPVACGEDHAPPAPRGSPSSYEPHHDGQCSPHRQHRSVLLGAPPLSVPVH